MFWWEGRKEIIQILITPSVLQLQLRRRWRSARRGINGERNSSLHSINNTFRMLKKLIETFKESFSHPLPCFSLFSLVRQNCSSLVSRLKCMEFFPLSVLKWQENYGDRWRLITSRSSSTFFWVMLQHSQSDLPFSRGYWQQHDGAQNARGIICQLGHRIASFSMTRVRTKWN